MTRRAVELPAVVSRGAAAPLPRGRGLLTLLLLASIVLAALRIDWRESLPRAGGLDVLRDILAGLLAPDLSPEIVGRAIDATWTTVVYGVAGMTVALVLGLPLGVLASGALASSPAPKRLSMVGARTLLSAMRAIHELVWAWLLVVAIGLSPYAAVVAIGIPYAGILGRISADLLNDLPPGPERALVAAGAGRTQALLYGRLPMALPDLAAYSFYRFECALRASAIMGFVGLGGLGFEIQVALADLDYRQVSTYLLALLLLIVAVEVWSSLLRNALGR